MNLFNIFRREEKASAAGGIISGSTVGRPVWTPRDYEAFSREAYVQNAVAFRCVSMIAQASAECFGHLLLYRGEQEVEVHPVLDLLDSPNTTLGRAQFFEAMFSFLLLSGNGYVESVGPTNQPPRELWNLRPDRMKVVAGPFGTPSAFEYEFEGRTKRWPVKPTTGMSDVMHLRTFHPTDDWYGLSRVEPAAFAVDRHNASSAHNKALLDNGARPSGALVYKPIRGTEGDKSAPADAVKGAFDALMERHGGPKNAGKPMVLNGNVDWLEMGTNPKDMDFRESKMDAARDICEAFGVPNILIVPGSSTYNNVREAKLALYEETVLPLVSLTITGLNTWLLPRFDDGLKLSVDVDGLPALEPRRETRRSSIVELLDKGVIDANEAREALQYGPRNADTVVLPQVDGPTVTALANSVDKTGYEPLLRYLKAVGLYDPNKTPENMMADVLDLIENDDDEEDDDEEEETTTLPDLEENNDDDA